MEKENQDTQKTNQFKQLYEYIKENIAPIALLINVVGFVNYFIYYKSFGIPIFSYVGLNDLIFFVLEYVLAIVLVILLVDFILNLILYIIYYLILSFLWMFKKSKKDIEELSKEDKEKAKNKNDKRESAFLWWGKVIIMGIAIFLTAYFPFKQITIPAYIIYALYLYASAKDKGLNSKIIILASLIIVIGLVSKTMIDTLEKSQEKQDYTISFVENNELITTEKGESTLNYIGESSIAIFLYDIEREEARIHNKSNITDIRTQPSELYAWIIDCMLSMRNWISSEKDKQQ